jgi:hypothetical protein
MNGSYTGSRDKDELKELKGRIGEIDVSGRVSISRFGKRRVDVELASPRVDLTPFTKATDNAGKTKPKPSPKAKFVFDEAPLPLGPLKTVNAKLHLAVAEVVFSTGTLRNVDSTVTIGGGRLALEARAKDRFEGTVNGSLTLAAASEATADLQLDVDARSLRTGFLAGGGIEPGQAPAMSVKAKLVARGASARQLASSLNGQVLATQAPGKIGSGVIGTIGGDIVGQLASRLNPFAAQETHMQLECTIARVDIVDGRATVRPVLMQSDKVAIIASGKIDLHTEALRFDFNTRPRRGVGITPGMFANPFIEIAGTLASPRLGVGSRGAIAGGAAAATGGLTIFAQGLMDRALGQQDLCKETLDQAVKPAK